MSCTPIDTSPPQPSSGLEVSLAPPDLRAAAHRYLAAGLSLIPIDHRTKKPDNDLLPRSKAGKPTWKPFQKNIVDKATLDSWFASGLKSIAVVGGAISCPTGQGGLLVFDFDDQRFYHAWLREVGVLAVDLPVQRTGGGGYQAYCYCPNPGRNAKLAWVPCETEESGRTIAIETRAEAGYAVLPDSLHPSGNYYRMEIGDLANIPTISQHDADALIAAARKLDECPYTRQQRAKLEVEARLTHERTAAKSRNGNTGVITAFNQAHSIEGLLESNGYTRSGDRYVRPGGKSASVSVKDGRSCHFSSNDPLNDSQVTSDIGVHDAFDVYAYYQHNGDVKNAVKAAARLLGIEAPSAQSQTASSTPQPLPKALTFKELRANNPKLRQAVVEGLLRVGETANFIASTKVGKTWLTYALALCVATGRPFLNRFATIASRVLLIDNELHTENIADRIPKVAEAMGIMSDEYEERLEVLSLRGKLADLHRLRAFLSQYSRGYFGLIIVDAWYRALPVDTDENANGEITQLYNLLDNMADVMGAAFVVVHHASKGVQGGKAVTDVGAGAGSMSRAVDAHIVIRPHEEDGAFVMDAAVRSWAPIKPVGLRFRWPIWTIDEGLDPTLLKLERPRKVARAKAEPVPKEVWDAARFVAEFLTDTPQTAAVILSQAGNRLSDRKADQFLKAACDLGLAYRWTLGSKLPDKYATREQTLTEIPATPPKSKAAKGKARYA